ncbi:MAG: AMP-binding protein [Deltaproteobacteria bacterium]|nr:AMP-binding protein [Deltaproteobacteria bacterium]MBW2049146.1 AMP-binding protein [Deltaproteobacteria bacterium]MBW2112768.1 AMP-binding protein [Deltaproteobacteria bacterium]MBW2354874.1 AMP-binding protein [Deltaproteobacteria bacterium]
MTISAEWPPRYDYSHVPSPDSEYWNEELETMDPEEREQKVILPRLQAQLKYAYQKSPFYRTKWDNAGIGPEDVQSLKDFENIPIVTKDEIRQDQKENPPFGSNLCVSMKELARVQGTSGTTGKPTAFGISKGDMKRIAEAHARFMWGFGVRQDDIVFIGSFFSLYWGSWGALAGAERLGATAFPFGAGVAGQSDRAIEWMKEVKPTIFYGTPSYSLYLAEKAKAKGLDPREDFNFRILFFSGEPGAGIPSTKKRIEETYGGICIDSGSTAEMSPWMSDCECAHRKGMHLWQDVVFAELVDPDTKKRVPYGSEGATVYTHLERTSQPMIRFWSGDISMWVNDPCPCGRTYPRLPKGIYGRADDMFVVRGENVYPSAIEDVLRGIKGFGDEYRIIISRSKAMDEMVVQAEPTPEVKVELIPGLKVELETRLKASGLRTTVQMLEPGALERTEFKAKRVIDKRSLYDEIIEK